MALTTEEMGLSQFPGGVDTFPPVFDLPPHLVAAYEQLQALKRLPFLNFNEQADLNRLVMELADYMITPDMFNHFTSAISSLQRFFNNETIGFIQERQAEMNARINQFQLVGVHNESLPYLHQNMVHRDETGDLYIALRDIGAGTPINDESAWRRLSTRGAEGQPGVALTWRGEFHLDNTYVTGEAVRFNSSIWWATANIPQNTPPPHQSWQSISPFTMSAERPNIQTGMIWRQDLGTL